MDWIGLVVALILGMIVYFLGKEHLKKFRIMGNLFDKDLVYDWPGGSERRMGKIVLVSNEPFGAAIGFDFTIPLYGYAGVDPFGYLEAERKSDCKYYAVIETFLGKGPVWFRFALKKTINEQEIWLLDYTEAQNHRPMLTCKPHFYQKIGFYS